PELVVVPAGRFEMGDLQGNGDPDEAPVREVTLARPFALGRYEGIPSDGRRPRVSALRAEGDSRWLVGRASA
ncbi:MAG: SUMF1/EgtB/PvdO family nonheme iron enzyme, partial [Myxococcota bacterium]